jgi:hypothetical protein
MTRPLEEVVLQMKAMGIRDVNNFPFPTQPNAKVHTLHYTQLLLPTRTHWCCSALASWHRDIRHRSSVMTKSALYIASLILLRVSKHLHLKMYSNYKVIQTLMHLFSCIYTVIWNRACELHMTYCAAWELLKLSQRLLTKVLTLSQQYSTIYY